MRRRRIAKLEAEVDFLRREVSYLRNGGDTLSPTALTLTLMAEMAQGYRAGLTRGDEMSIEEEVDRSLPIALDRAMRYAMKELGSETLRTTPLTVALVAESLIAAGYPAGLGEGNDGA